VVCLEESRTSAISSPLHLLLNPQGWSALLQGCLRETPGWIASDHVKLSAEGGRRGRPGSSFGQEEGGQGLSSSQQNRVLSFLLWEAVAGGTVRAPWEEGGALQDQQQN